MSNPSERLPGYYTANEIAAELDVSQTIVRRWIKEGRVLAYKVGRDYAVPEAELAKLRKRDRKPGPKGKAK